MFIEEGIFFKAKKIENLPEFFGFNALKKHGYQGKGSVIIVYYFFSWVKRNGDVLTNLVTCVHPGTTSVFYVRQRQDYYGYSMHVYHLRFASAFIKMAGSYTSTRVEAQNKVVIDEM